MDLSVVAPTNNSQRLRITFCYIWRFISFFYIVYIYCIYIVYIYMLHDSLDFVMHKTEIWAVWRPQVWCKKVWRFLRQQFSCCTCAVPCASALSCWNKVVTRHPTSDVASRQRLRSSSRHHLVVPRHRRSTLGRRAFFVAGPMAWNALPDDLRDPSLSADNFRKKLKTHLFRNALGHLVH